MTKMEDFGNLSSLAIRLPGSGIYQGTLQYIKINNFDAIPIYDAAGNDIANNTLFAGQVYVFRFRITADGGEVTSSVIPINGTGIMDSDYTTYVNKTTQQLDQIRQSLVYTNKITEHTVHLDNSTSTSKYATLLTINRDTFRGVQPVPETYTFTYSSAASSWKLNGTNVSLATYGISYPGSVTEEDGDRLDIVQEYLEENYPSYLQYFKDDNLKLLNWYLQGSGQCFAKYSEEGNSFSDDIIYSVPNVGYEILQVKDYSQLTDNDACREQAEYDTYDSCVKQDTITIQTIIIPWLEPHQKIQYRVKLTGEVSDWLIKSISWNTESGTMSITMYRFIQDFQYIWDKKYTKYYALVCKDYNGRILDENDYKEGEKNLTEYSTAMTPFFLVSPIRNYYDFKGWTGKYLTDQGYVGPQTRVIIIEKTKGDLDFTANWQPTVYNIQYFYTNFFDSEAGILTEINSDAWFPSARIQTYDYEDPTFTLVNAS